MQSSQETKCKLSVGPLRLPAGELFDSPLSMSEYFAQAFSSVFVAEPLLHLVEGQVCHGQMAKVWVDVAEVFSVLNSLHVSSAAGPDGMYPRLLKCCAGKMSPA